MRIELHSVDMHKRDSDLTEWGLIVVIIVLALIAAVPVLGSFLCTVLSHI
jgi:Flp pilus assembly pilin Flp